MLYVYIYVFFIDNIIYLETEFLALLIEWVKPLTSLLVTQMNVNIFSYNKLYNYLPYKHSEKRFL